MNSSLIFKKIKTFKGSYFLTLILLLPMVGMISKFENPLSKEVFDELMHTTGEFGTRIMILCLYISPLLVLWPQSSILQWLSSHKRNLGLLAFSYTLLHLSFYLIHKNYSVIISDLKQITYIAGWIGFILFLPLAITSNNHMIRKLGGVQWKNLHRLIYLAAVLTAIHWLLKEGNGEENASIPVLIHFGPLFLLEVYRYIQFQKRQKKVEPI